MTKVSAKKTPKTTDSGLNFEAQLWAAADKMRGHMDASEYKHVCLGLIFLKYMFPQITFDSISRFKIILPPIEFQRKFVSQVAPLDKRIKANKEESRTLSALRDALLPKLLSGELRVPISPN